MSRAIGARTPSVCPREPGSSLEGELRTLRLKVSDLMAQKTMLQNYAFCFAAALAGDVDENTEAFAADSIESMKRGLGLFRSSRYRKRRAAQSVGVAHADSFRRIKKAYEERYGAPCARSYYTASSRRRSSQHLPSPDSPQTGEPGKCCVCLTAQASHVFYPCLHVCYCEECGGTPTCGSCEGHGCQLCGWHPYTCPICRALSTVPPVLYKPGEKFFSASPCMQCAMHPQ